MITNQLFLFYFPSDIGSINLPSHPDVVIHATCVAGGHSVVSCSRGTSGLVKVFNASGHLVDRLYLCRDDHKEATVSW